jgi:hypothetical protein
MDTFRIRCRHSTSSGQTVKLDIQLYKVETNNYLVDFKKVAKQDHLESSNLSTFAFFDACSKLIAELAIT